MNAPIHAYDYPLSHGSDPVRLGELAATLTALSEDIRRAHTHDSTRTESFPLTNERLYRDHKLWVGLKAARARIDEAAHKLADKKSQIAIAPEDAVRSNMLASFVREAEAKIRACTSGLCPTEEVAAHIDLYRVCAENLVVLHLEALSRE